MTIRIAIIGAGPAGCTLARLLAAANKDIQVTIFESEATLNFRSQGGTLDLRTNFGLAAVKAAGLWDDFLKHARYDGEALRITDKNFLTYISMSGSKKEHKDLARPEIDRPELRRILFESLPKDCVKWGKKLLQIDSDNIMHFQDGTTASGFDLIVGADGAWSKARTRVTDIKPFYSGMSGFQFNIPNGERDHRELYDRVNRGSLFSYSDGKSIMPQQMGDGSISVGVWITQPEDWQKQAAYDVHDTAAVAAHLRTVFQDWDPRLVEYTQQLDASVTARELYMLPIGNTWIHSPGVTLIGDAAHLATPFAGRGVNEALLDALKLSQSILSAADAKDAAAALDTNVDEFEKDMFMRGKNMQEETYRNLQFMFLQPDAPRSGIEKFILGAIRDEMGLLTWLIAPIVYAYFFVFKLLNPAKPKKNMQ